MYTWGDGAEGQLGLKTDKELKVTILSEGESGSIVYFPHCRSHTFHAAPLEGAIEPNLLIPGCVVHRISACVSLAWCQSFRTPKGLVSGLAKWPAANSTPLL